MIRGFSLGGCRGVDRWSHESFIKDRERRGQVLPIRDGKGQVLLNAGES